MEKTNTTQPDPASTPETEQKRDFTGRQFPNQHQFEEAVLRLQEEYEKKAKRSDGVFY